MWDLQSPTHSRLYFPFSQLSNGAQRIQLRGSRGGKTLKALARMQAVSSFSSKALMEQQDTSCTNWPALVDLSPIEAVAWREEGFLPEQYDVVSSESALSNLLHFHFGSTSGDMAGKASWAGLHAQTSRFGFYLVLELSEWICGTCLTRLSVSVQTTTVVT